MSYSKLNFDSIEYALQPATSSSIVQELTGAATYPKCLSGQVYRRCGGCLHDVEVGELQEKLQAGAKPAEGDGNTYGDPFEFLPKWMTANPLRSK